MNRYIAWMVVSGNWGIIFHDTETCAGWDLMHGVAWTLVAFVGLGYLFCFVLMFARRNERGGRIAGFVLRQLGLVRGTRGRASCWQCVALHPPRDSRLPFVGQTTAACLALVSYSLLPECHCVAKKWGLALVAASACACVFYDFAFLNVLSVSLTHR